MSYIFPKRELNDADVLDPVELNEDYVPAAELASGKLNAHNLASTITSGLSVETGAYFTWVKATSAVNPRFGSPGSYTAPDPTSLAANAIELASGGGWETIETASLTTGVAQLWIVGRLQYSRCGWAAAAPFLHGDAWTGAQVQVALRVDGSILEWSITGRSNEYEQSSYAYRPLNPRGAVLGPAVEVSGAAGCGPELMSVRVGAVFEAAVGVHTIELVARRLGRVDITKRESTDDVVFALSSQLFALQMPTHAPSGSTLSAVEAPAFEAEEAFSAASIGTDRLKKVRDALNEVKDGSLARGALNHNHLPSPVVYTAQATIGSDSLGTALGEKIIDNQYPGFSDATVTTVPSGAATGWYLLDDLDGKQLEVTGFDMTEKAIFIVTANVRCQRVHRPLYPSEGNAVACFTLLRTDDSGTSSVMQATEGYTNHHLWWNTLGDVYSEADDHVDIPLFAVIDNSDGNTISNMASIGVYGSTLKWTTDGSVIEFLHGCINVIQVRV